MARLITPDEPLHRRPLRPDQLRRYGELLARQPRRDYLDAIDSERRALTLHLDSDRLLRTADNSRQARVMGRIRGELREQIRAQMLGRRAFRGPVSVEIDLHATGVSHPPTSPPR